MEILGSRYYSDKKVDVIRYKRSLWILTEILKDIYDYSSNYKLLNSNKMKICNISPTIITVTGEDLNILKKLLPGEISKYSSEISLISVFSGISTLERLSPILFIKYSKLLRFLLESVEAELYLRKLLEYKKIE